MRLAVLFSGGKDSILALHRAVWAHHTIVALIHVTSTNPTESRMYHLPTPNLVELQAQSLRIPIIRVYSNENANNELKPLQEVLLELKKSQHLEGFVTGAVESVYQSTRLEKIGHQLELECFSPLWQIDSLQEWKELLQKKFDVTMVAVMANGLDSSWLGQSLSASRVKTLLKLANRYQFHRLGEGGEFETTVLDAPLFHEKIKLKQSHIELSGDAATLVVEKAMLVPKTKKLRSTRLTRKVGRSRLKK